MSVYVPNTEEEQKEMLKSIGFDHIDDLYKNVPKEVLLKGELNLPKGLSEFEVRRKFEGLAKKNTVFTSIFRGAGAYNHYIPALVKQITSKEELITSYTPYQPEISQGALQSMFEYQTMICDITGMDASNASVYDGASAAAEAVIMCNERKKNKVLISLTSPPEVISTIKTYSKAIGMEVVLIPQKSGKTDLDQLKENIDKETACVYVQHPNYYGLLEDLPEIADLIHEQGGKLIQGCNPTSLGILKSPGENGADIAVGEAQPLGIPLSFGGPYIGFMATKKKHLRRLPGRIVGQTEDSNGKRAFVLTLQAREQHIRREKASSNICSNQALCAQTVAIYLTTMGKTGFKEVALQSMSKAHYLADELNKIKGFELVHEGEFFHEFLTNAPDNMDKVYAALESEGILAGYPINNDGKEQILWCATEMNTKEEMDRLISILKEVAN